MSEKSAHVHKLDAFSATAIAGNDILSSCLYVCGITAIYAGVYSPLVFILIVIVLALYRHVYVEVVEALPLNGGAYNCLLNATSKSLAAVAGVMTVLSYVATSVISAKTASEYVHTIAHDLPFLELAPVMPLTAGIIIFFAILTILGVKDSAKVAKGIFSLHIFSLLLFISMGFIKIANEGWGFLPANLLETQAIFSAEGTVKMIFLAFAASLLGVSGFESSANFVEEQDKGVFRKTLRYMLIGVLVFNPLISVVALSSMGLTELTAARDFLLAFSAKEVGGQALQYLIVADAFLVLSGAVLASFVGATGLLYRMTLDHCLPQSLLLPKLKRRNQNATRIIIAFALLCLSILFITQGNLLSLAGVYTISFLGVMTAFAMGNVILRKNRPDLKRTYQGPLFYVLVAAAATGSGIIGNILIDPKNLVYFLMYFGPAFLLVMSMIYRDYILEALMKATRFVPIINSATQRLFEHVTKPRIILFAHDPAKLYASLNYIRINETSRNITVVFCDQGKLDAAKIEKFREFITFFKEAKIFNIFSIDLVVEREIPFGPEAVKAYANRFKVNRTNVFIGSLHEEHTFSFEELGGVRIIQ